MLCIYTNIKAKEDDVKLKEIMCTYYLDSSKNGLILKKKNTPEVTKM